MSNTFKKYYSELLVKLRQLDSKIASGLGDSENLIESRKEILRQIKKVKEVINEKNESYIIKTKKGYLTADSKYTDNINLAYVYSEDEAVQIARKLGGWLEMLPN